jgi:hypothetical protein
LFTDLAAYQINAVVSVTGCTPSILYDRPVTANTGLLKLPMLALFAHQASAIGANFEATI